VHLNTILRLINSVFFKDLFDVPRPAASEKHLSAKPTPSDEVTSHTESGAEPQSTGPQATQASNRGAVMDEELDIEASTPDLILFAKFLTFAVQFRSFVQATSLQISLEQAGILLPLADRYECFDLRTILRQRVAFLAKTKPWEVLVLASKQNDVDMGRTAISNLTEKLVHDANEEDSDRSVMANIAKLDGPWQLEFLRLFFKSTRRRSSDSDGGYAIVGDLNMKFDFWCKYFNPARYEEGAVTGKRKRV
jgi:hypothetical protein